MQFERESNLGDEATLIDAANKAGVTGADELFKTDAEKDNVLREVAMVQSDYGVTGVPFFIFDDKFAVRPRLQCNACSVPQRLTA